MVLIAVFVFWWRWAVAGLALSSSLGATVNAAWLIAALRRRLGFSLGRALGKDLAPIGAAAIVTGLLAYGLWYYAPPLGAPLVKMLVVTFLGAGVYIGLLRALRVHEVEDILRWVLKKK